jgi:hypothetical protein
MSCNRTDTGEAEELTPEEKLLIINTAIPLPPEEQKGIKRGGRLLNGRQTIRHKPRRLNQNPDVLARMSRKERKRELAKKLSTRKFKGK